MISFETMSFAMIMLICLVAFFRIIYDVKSKALVIVSNVVLGGALYILLNMFGISIYLNLCTGALITLLGPSGVCLIILLKVIFKIF